MKDIRKLSNYEEPLIEGEGSREAGEEPEIVLAPAEEAVHRADTQNTEPISKTLEVLRKAEEKNKKDRNGRHVLGEILELAHRGFQKLRTDGRNPADRILSRARTLLPGRKPELRRNRSVDIRRRNGGMLSNRET